MIPLAEILRSGASSVARDATRAIRLCERAASVRWEYSLSTAVLARKIAYGSSQIQANVQLAVYLCQMRKRSFRPLPPLQPFPNFAGYSCPQ